MLHRTRVARAASSTWFSSGPSGATLIGCTKSLIICLVGIGMINFVFRGNVMGVVQDEKEVIVPARHLLYKRENPAVYGFVGDAVPSDEVEKAKEK
ncbi:hypothetical protein AGDE_01212 [Angomonas deanei]|uniref:Uncharacterized protein n=1 Tax=Angomonas deanei TaxID=59799 RepID=A0A7G2CBK1_9TRYP|nr:hypothetical protein AGDE_01212 [Angomonas deanei]CAD2217186.1 hypothetical protein, conserved [Angomonas deanei]|eukprot:EPY42711.1 hypothetical protein AGDE_01212 [Angomonas deanei]